MWKYGIKYKTDKLTHHGYHRFYDMYLYPIRNEKINLLEIGVDSERSFKMWLDMFPNATIYGMDIGFEKKYPRGEIFKGDQSKIEDLEHVVEQTSKCQVIIDDGSHVPEHQLLTFNYMFNKCLDYGGTYIIEDIETSYWKDSELYGYPVSAGYNAKNSIVKIFKDVIDIVNFEFMNKTNLKKLVSKSLISFNNLKYISSINFGGNCIIIKKMTLPEYDRYRKRQYRFADNL